MFWSFSLTVPYAILLADVNHSKREGSNDGTTWRTLDTQIGIVFNQNETKLFDFINELEMLGLISANTISRGRGRGRTNIITLQCDTDLIDKALMYKN